MKKKQKKKQNLLENNLIIAGMVKLLGYPINYLVLLSIWHN
jgi:hypothetical protein